MAATGLTHPSPASYPASPQQATGSIPASTLQRHPQFGDHAAHQN
jgi:hypothetical protein